MGHLPLVMMKMRVTRRMMTMNVQHPLNPVLEKLRLKLRRLPIQRMPFQHN